jgi:nitrogen regulatory protein PII
MIDKIDRIDKKNPVLRLLVFIIDWSKTKIISKIFEEEKVRFHFVSKGMGTATSEILDLLGIGSTDKAIILCLEQAVMVPILMKEVRQKLGFNNPGVGIAFTLPLSGINGPIMQVFKGSINKNEKLALQKPDEPRRIHEMTNSLVMAIINQKYSDEFMNTARAAGATGGTVIVARGQSREGIIKFFGVSVQNERAMILILTRGAEQKKAIMDAVSAEFGISSNAGGIIFSLPVDHIMGLNFE